MIPLIKREIFDNIIFFVGALITEIILVSYLIIMNFLSYDTNSFSIQDIYGMYISLFIMATIIFSVEMLGMGISQMYIDKNKKISSFLSTLSVTRSRIITARIIAGILALLILFLPLLITMIISSGYYGIPLMFYKKVFFEVFISVFFVCMASYFIGLLLGWTSRKILPIFGGMVLMGIIISIMFVKGFSWPASLLLILFILSSLVCIKQKFISTSL